MFRVGTHSEALEFRILTFLGVELDDLRHEFLVSGGHFGPVFVLHNYAFALAADGAARRELLPADLDEEFPLAFGGDRAVQYFLHVGAMVGLELFLLLFSQLLQLDSVAFDFVLLGNEV